MVPDVGGATLKMPIWGHFTPCMGPLNGATFVVIFFSRIISHWANCEARTVTFIERGLCDI